MIYTGIIDNTGLESFVPKNKAKNVWREKLFVLRAMANPQRKPKVYECKPTKTQLKIITALLNREHFTLAEYAVRASRNYRVIWPVKKRRLAKV